MGACQVTFDPTSAVPEDQFDPTSAMPESAPSTRDVINAAVRFNPDQAAQADRLSRKYPLDPNTLLRNLQNVQLQEIVDKHDQTLQTSPKLSRYMREKPWLAAQAHDDLEPLKKVESYASLRWRPQVPPRRRSASPRASGARRMPHSAWSATWPACPRWPACLGT